MDDPEFRKDDAASGTASSPPPRRTDEARIARQERPAESHAMVALISSMLGLLMVLPVVGALLGIYLGRRSLRRLEGAEGESADLSRRLAYRAQQVGFVGLLAAALVLPVLSWQLRPLLAAGREQADRMTCLTHVQAIAKTASLYEHWDQGAPTVAILQARGDLPEDVRCLSVDDSTGEDMQYIIVPWPADTVLSKLPPDTVMVYEPRRNHGGVGGAFCFADGHAEFVRGERYDQLMEQIHRTLREGE
jgi:hypothetical protein